jgi:hypothetical protein
MCNKDLQNEFKRFEGQLVVICGKDNNQHLGVVVEACKDYARIMNDNDRLSRVEYRHIDHISEAQKRLPAGEYTKNEKIKEERFRPKIVGEKWGIKAEELRPRTVGEKENENLWRY